MKSFSPVSKKKLIALVVVIACGVVLAWNFAFSRPKSIAYGDGLITAPRGWYIGENQVNVFLTSDDSEKRSSSGIGTKGRRIDIVNLDLDMSPQEWLGNRAPASDPINKSISWKSVSGHDVAVVEHASIEQGDALTYHVFDQDAVYVFSLSPLHRETSGMNGEMTDADALEGLVAVVQNFASSLR